MFKLKHQSFACDSLADLQCLPLKLPQIMPLIPVDVTLCHGSTLHLGRSWIGLVGADSRVKGMEKREEKEVKNEEGRLTR